MFLLNFLTIGRRLSQVAAALWVAVLAVRPLASHAAKNWAGEVIYLALLDRFAGGDPSKIGNVL
jgi:hypothetical protein